MPQRMQCPFCRGTKIFKDMESEQERYYCRACQKYFSPEESAGNAPSKYSGKTEHPMRIFLSYGHPESEICKRIYVALKARGHDVWFDKTELEGRSGLNWRNAIQQGVKESNEVVACLSEHSMRERGVCLDELGIAIGVKGGAGCIHSVLLGKEEKIDPPPTITHDQWLDMRDWQEQLAKGEAEFAPWFQGKMQDLLESLESEKNRKFSGEIETIRTRLNVQYATSKQEKLLLQPFVGREWLQKKIDAWLGQAGSEKMSFVSGEPGVGKSAFAAHYAHHNPHAAAILMCEHDMESYNSAKTVIQTLAFLLACRIPEYRQSLLDFLPQEKAELANYSEKELFERLIQNPFSRIVDGDFEPRVIVLDGLDECGDPAQNTLAKTLNEYADRLPHWLHILVIGRATAPMLTYAKNARRIPILADSAENRNDIQAYYLEKLQKTFAKDPNWNAALERMTQRSQGVFLYAELLCDLLLSRGELLPENDYPDGLDAVFARWFGWFFPDLQDYKAHWRPAIGCLLGAPELLPEKTLQEIFAWGENELADFKLRLKVLLREGKNEFDETTLVISHDYMREWLQRNPGENIYYASPKDGKKKIANTLWAKRSSSKKGLSYSEYIVLAMTKPKESLAGYYDLVMNLIFAAGYCKNSNYSKRIYKMALDLAEDSLKKIKEKDSGLFWIMECQKNLGVVYEAQGYFDEALELCWRRLRNSKKLLQLENKPCNIRQVMLCYWDISRILEEQKNFSKALIYAKKALKVLNKKHQNFANFGNQESEFILYVFDLSRICVEIARLLNGTGNINEALKLMNETIEFLESKSEIQVKSLNVSITSEALQVCYNGLAGLLEEQGNYSKALKFYYKSNAILEKMVNHGEFDLHINDLRIDLSEGHYNIAGILKEEWNWSDALKECKKSLVITEKLLKEKNTPTLRRNLSVIYDRIGEILQSQGKLYDGLKNIQKSFKIRKELEQEQNTPEARRDLSISYSNIGNILEAQGNLDAALESYKKSLEITEKLAKEQNTPEIHRDLVVGYNKVGNILKVLGKFDAAMENCKKSFAIAEKLDKKQNTPESRRDLSISYNNIGNILEAQGKLEEALEKYQESLAIREELAKEQNTPDSRRDLSVSYDNIGNILEAQGKLDAALEKYQKSLAIRKELEKEQNTPESRRDLAVSYNNMGNIVEQKGDLAGALDYFQKSYTIFEQLNVKYDTIQFNQYLQIVERSIARTREKLNLK